MESNTNVCVISLFLLILSFGCEAQLSTTFYDISCPKATTTIGNAIRSAILGRGGELRMAASLIRLHFHDCFVQGCDGSVLLDETASIQSEKSAVANNNSIRGFNVIEAAKLQVERICPGVVSCADILALAARDSSIAVGGPSWAVRLGRRDSTTASRSLANTNLPSPFSDLQTLITSFSGHGFTAREMVALSGSHTLGQARCTTFRARIYGNGTNLNPVFAAIRRRSCPPTGGDNNLAPLDSFSPNFFDNTYFRNLQQRAGLLISDQVLFAGGSGSTDNVVLDYVRNPRLFASEFAAAMVKMGDLSPLTGQDGIIRRICSAVN